MKYADLPPDLTTILRAAAFNGGTRYVSIFYLEDGSVQANAQDPKDSASWRVATSNDPVMALMEVLGPRHGGSWTEHLKPVPGKAPKKKNPKKETTEKLVEKPWLDGDDDFDVV